MTFNTNLHIAVDGKEVAYRLRQVNSQGLFQVILDKKLLGSEDMTVYVKLTDRPGVAAKAANTAKSAPRAAQETSKPITQRSQHVSGKTYPRKYPLSPMALYGLQGKEPPAMLSSPDYAGLQLPDYFKIAVQYMGARALRGDQLALAQDAINFIKSGKANVSSQKAQILIDKLSSELNKETPWCGAFIACTMILAGLGEQVPGDFLAAISYTKVGPEITDKRRYQPGAIMVFKGDGVHNHVSYFAGYYKDEKGNIDYDRFYCYGGNQNTIVDINPYNRDNLIGAYWPASAGTMPVNKDPVGYTKEQQTADHFFQTLYSDVSVYKTVNFSGFSWIKDGRNLYDEFNNGRRTNS